MSFRQPCVKATFLGFELSSSFKSPGGFGFCRPAGLNASETRGPYGNDALTGVTPVRLYLEITGRLFRLGMQLGLIVPWKPQLRRSQDSITIFQHLDQVVELINMVKFASVNNAHITITNLGAMLSFKEQ